MLLADRLEAFFIKKIVHSLQIYKLHFIKFIRPLKTVQRG